MSSSLKVPESVVFYFKDSANREALDAVAKANKLPLHSCAKDVRAWYEARLANALFDAEYYDFLSGLWERVWGLKLEALWPEKKDWCWAAFEDWWTGWPSPENLRDDGLLRCFYLDAQGNEEKGSVYFGVQLEKSKTDLGLVLKLGLDRKNDGDWSEGEHLSLPGWDWEPKDQWRIKKGSKPTADQWDIDGFAASAAEAIRSLLDHKKDQRRS